MIADMPRPRPPYLSHSEHVMASPFGTCAGTASASASRPRSARRSSTAEYQTAIATAPQRPQTGAPTTGTLGWLIECFRASAAWQARCAQTRDKWNGIYRQALQAAGDAPLSAITPKAIRTSLERRAETPGQAQHFLNAMRALFRWALKMQLVRIDPTVGIAAPARRRDAGFDLGRRTTSTPTRSDGRSARGNACGSTCCSLPDFAGRCREARAPARPRRHSTIKTEKTGTIVPSRSCRCWPKP